jgi:hypothetical protein
MIPTFIDPKQESYDTTAPREELLLTRCSKQERPTAASATGSNKRVRQG